MVAVNCAAIPANLIESELFGYERGAFTGAVAGKPGKIEQADGGALFLDEIGDLPLDAQAKLLRALQERKFERIAGKDTIA
jgi:transcriptional regulator with PAS, ATPase and Fis domain